MFFSGLSLQEIILRLVAIVWAITFHEFCHAWVAWKLGDKTAAYEGRVSLNPLVHFDPVGAFMLLFFRFGWARPVPINSRYFKNPRRDIALVALAGPAGNILTAFVVALVWNMVSVFFPGIFFDNPVVASLLSIMLWMNIGLASFNLIPIPPLDGSKILASFLPAHALRSYLALEQYGMFILVGLLMTGILSSVMAPVALLFHTLIMKLAAMPFFLL